ncbi:MAG: hypothetical protein JW753_03070 [Dehalococcoidia bacterium]|nr:hypothetical protein [Dehalococcoidia bacterium]
MTRVKTGLRLFAAAALLVTSMLAVTGASTACSKGPKAFVALMDIAPEQSDCFAYWAIADLSEDEDLWEIYDRFKESSDAEQLRELVQALAIVKDSARVFSMDNATTSQAPVTAVRAKYNTSYVEDQLETQAYSRSEHRDVGIWIAGDGQPYRPIALLSGTILIGNATDLKACIDAAKNKAESFYDDPYIQVLAKRLPNGIVVEACKATASSGSTYTDLVAYGKSYKKLNGDMLKVTAVYVFGDAPAAGTALQPIKENLSVGFQDVKIDRDDNLVIATAKIPISSLAQTLEF